MSTREDQIGRPFTLPTQDEIESFAPGDLAGQGRSSGTKLMTMPEAKPLLMQLARDAKLDRLYLEKKADAREWPARFDELMVNDDARGYMEHITTLAAQRLNGSIKDAEFDEMAKFYPGLNRVVDWIKARPELKKQLTTDRRTQAQDISKAQPTP